ncbi:MAG: C2H2-type zinc finger protein [Phycisphaerae bacterium]
MAKATGKNYKCGKCGRTFKMAAHLARHQKAGHGTKKKKRSGKKKRPVGRPRKTAAARANKGRTSARAPRLGLANLSIEQLGSLIVAARAEAKKRISALKKSIT